MFFTSVFSKLKLWQTFLILSLLGLLLASIPTYLYTKEAGKALDAYAGEQAGMPAVTGVLKAIQLTQQHRALSALLLSGVPGADEKRSAKQREADAAYADVDQIVKATGNDTIIGAWAPPRSDWESLRAAVSGKSLTPPQSYTAHVQLLAKMLTVNEMVADEYGLSLDPDKDSYQLIQAIFFQLPALTEELGQLRAKGAAILSKKEATPEERLLVSGMIARVNDRMAQTANAFGKAATVNADIASKLGPLMADAGVQSKKLTDAANATIVQADTLSADPKDYVTLATQTIDAQFTLMGSARTYIETMLTSKVASFYKTRWTMLGSMLVLIAIGAYLTVIISRAVTVPLNNAVSVAQSVARGNLVNEFDVGSDNEVGLMLRALKEMNDSLRTIVGDVRASIDNISAATRDIASGNADVSQRLESQASNLEETASSMEELTSTVRQNADNARQANDLVLGRRRQPTRAARWWRKWCKPWATSMTAHARSSRSSRSLTALPSRPISSP